MPVTVMPNEALKVSVTQAVYSPCTRSMRSSPMLSLARPLPRGLSVNGIFIAPAPSSMWFAGPSISPRWTPSPGASGKRLPLSISPLLLRVV